MQFGSNHLWLNESFSWLFKTIFVADGPVCKRQHWLFRATAEAWICGLSANRVGAQSPCVRVVDVFMVEARRLSVSEGKLFLFQIARAEGSLSFPAPCSTRHPGV